MIHRIISTCLYAFLPLAAAWAAPTLRISVPEPLEDSSGRMLPVWIENGTDGPTDLFIEAWNAGDGNLDLEVSGVNAPWLTPELGGQEPCSFDAGRDCRRIRILFDADALPNGAFSGAVLVSDPDAVDAPQRVSITIFVGGNVPERLEFYISTEEGSSDFTEFQTPRGFSPTIEVEPDLPLSEQYLSVSSSGQGSFRFVHDHRVTARYRPGLSVGEREGSLTISGSTFERDNREVPVTVHVTEEPIARAVPGVLNFRTAEEISVAPRDVSLANRGLGMLEATDVEVSTDDGGDWLSVEELGGNAFRVSAEVEGLTPGVFTGRLRFESNAANGPIEVPVRFEVNEQTPPMAAFQGAVNGASFDRFTPLTPGAIVSIFGAQLSFRRAVASSTPLPTELAETQVLIDGVPAPLFFASFGQLNVQVPMEASQGMTTVQVIRGGMPGNEISVNIAPRSPGLFRLNIQEFGAIRNASQGNFPLPREVGQALGIDTAPARPGDILEVFATGLGEVAPQVGTGEPAGADPLSRTTQTPIVNFGRTFAGPFATPEFVGLSPGFVGLFQVNVAVPETAPTNPRTRITLEFPDGSRSNPVEIAVER